MRGQEALCIGDGRDDGPITMQIPTAHTCGPIVPSVFGAVVWSVAPKPYERPVSVLLNHYYTVPDGGFFMRSRRQDVLTSIPYLLAVGQDLPRFGIEIADGVIGGKVHQRHGAAE